MSSFDDFFEKQQRHGECDSRYSHSQDRDSFTHISAFARKLLTNKTLLILVGLVLVVALGLIAAALAFLLPLVPKLLGFLDINGLKGLLDQGQVILGKVVAAGGK